GGGRPRHHQARRPDQLRMPCDGPAHDRDLAHSRPGGAQRRFPARSRRGIESGRCCRARVQGRPAAEATAAPGGHARAHADACEAARGREGAAARVGASVTAGKRTAASILAALLYVVLLALFFAQVEIQVEGASGWAASLPTWRIERHWLLDWFWGGRPLTGYHAWVFSFMALVFHLPAVLLQRWSWRIELRILGALALFWIIEDWLWFVMNPAFGLARFAPQFVPWHKNWFG